MATKNGDKVGIREVYQLVDKKIEEVNQSINRLENKFDLLEAGRLSKIETTIADLKGRIFASTALIAFAISVGVAVLGLLLK